jgi:sugar diacid utilization regulator
MPSPAQSAREPAPGDVSGAASELGALEAISAAVESGAGLPEVVRAAARALEASLVLVDPSGSRLAVAARSPADEESLATGGDGVETVELRVAEEPVGRLFIRLRSGPPSPALMSLIKTLVASEVERVRAPERASAEAFSGFLHALLGRDPVDRDDLLARAAELGVELDQGGSIVVARAHPLVPTDDDWRARLVMLAERGARAAVPGAVAAPAQRDGVRGEEVVILVPDPDEALARRLADAVLRELSANLTGFSFAVGRSRVVADPMDLYRAGNEALLAANVAEADSEPAVLAFEQTGAYRLLLSTMSEHPDELQRFYAETVEPLIAYDEQYETELVPTLEAFLECDGNVAQTAQRMFTHRHTIRYRLERVRELSGLDVNSSGGREELSLGLKAMRVLGIAAPRGPATEAGTAAGRVPGVPSDRAR